ncbi:uncharacterized protein FTOL_07040 [Fusarium torulosum]|uniref:Uncharacterized protein n=1 Tax=Fusarium torulosum TaxID=33205 RepID=A0AAE8MB89_9HYPO|nr:uncharacterized protein FTOL_07040 [Fusarium torulosum]
MSANLDMYLVLPHYDDDDFSFGLNNSSTMTTPSPASRQLPHCLPAKDGTHFSREAVQTLKNWLSSHSDHPYPEEEEKEMRQRSGTLGLPPLMFATTGPAPSIFPTVLPLKYLLAITPRPSRPTRPLDGHIESFSPRYDRPSRVFYSRKPESGLVSFVEAEIACGAGFPTDEALKLRGREVLGSDKTAADDPSLLGIFKI